MTALPAPTTVKGAIVPGALVCSRFGSGQLCEVVEADHTGLLRYVLLGNRRAGEFTMYAEHAELCFSAKEA